MKKTKTILFAATLCTGVAAWAQPLALYTGGTLPTTQGWSEWRLDSSVNPIAAPVALDTTGGVLKLTSVNSDTLYSQLGWYKLNPGLDLNRGYTIDLKAKLKVAKKGSFNIQGYDNSGKGFRVTIADTFLTNQSDPLKATQTIASGLTGDNEFHVYRLAVKPSGSVDVYRDGEKIGSFALSTFKFDNIVENGGFEDEEFPDFLSNGTLRRIDDSSKVYAGSYALEASSDGKVTDHTKPFGEREAFRTRPFPVKPNTDYEISITRRRAAPEPWAWRDLGVFYNDQLGTLTEKDDRNDNITFGGANDVQWMAHNHNFTTPDTPTVRQSVRFEFPSWTRDGKKDISTPFDNIILRERHSFGVNSSIPNGIIEPVFHEGYVNLIENGSFENDTVNNDGTYYQWTISDETQITQNTPTGRNDLWNGEVRIQKHDKWDDQTGSVNDKRDSLWWAHSGAASLRFSSLGNGGGKMDFTKKLEPGKTYRFNFWHRSPKWPDLGWLKVKLSGSGADSVIWGHRLANNNNVWANADLFFTATESDTILHLYTEGYGSWFNIYLDDLVLYEVTGAVDPQIAGKTNLIANGDFENDTIDNEGNPYVWALASGSENQNDNYPVAWSEVWKSYVRLQDRKKNAEGAEDTGIQWAHSGSKALRVSYLNERGPAREFEGIASEVPETTLPKAYRVNINFEKELEANKTYTFVFWLKGAGYPDRGMLNVSNGDLPLWKEEISTKYVSWTRKSITFSTTAANHTLRMFTEWSGWCNFYLDDLFLYEEDTYVPYESEDSYLFFGKSQNTASTDVEVEYVKILTGGAHAPGEEKVVAVTYHYALTEETDTTIYAEYDVTNADFKQPIPEREFYSFVGWYSSADFTGDADAIIQQGTTGAKEYWGKWQLSSLEFTITYNENGGDSIPDSSYTFESEAVVLPATATRTGYTFAGWYDNAELTGEAVTEIPTGSIGHKAFWAKWAAVQYAITYHAAGVAGLADTTITYTIEDTVALPASQAIGYSVEWYANAELTGESLAALPAGSSGDKELWAKSEAIRYTVTYNELSGVAIPDTSYTIESPALVLPATTRAGYTFAGWYDNAQRTGNAITEIPQGSTGNKAFYAKWEEEVTAVSSLDASALRIYPNPVANGLLIIENLSGSGKVEIYSVSGSLMGIYSVSAAGSQAVVNISALPAGTYIVKANGKTGKITKF